jgi:hypothetical protein
MNHIQIREVLARNLTETLANNNLPHAPHAYQKETIESAIRWLNRHDAPRRSYVAQATGLGKTFEYSIIVRACKGLRVLVIVSGKTLVEQSIQDLVGFTEGTIAHASGLKKITDNTGDVLATHWKGRQHDVLVTTDESFKMKFDLIRQELDPHVIIWDECHWAYTEKAQEALDAFPEAVVVGFTATPDYLTTTAKQDYAPVTLDNGQVLYCPQDKMARAYFPELIDQRTVRWGIENRFLAPLAWGQLDFKLDLQDVPVVNTAGGMDFDAAELQRVMRKNWDFILQTIRKLYKSKQYQLGNRFAAAACPGISEAESLAEVLRGIGLRAESITNKTKDADRTRILTAGRNGELQHLSSVFALREGWNSPNAEVAMMLRPTKSRVFYVQFMGRVLRLYGDKVALVLDPHYQNTRFAPLSAPMLFGTPGQVVYDGDLLVAPRRRKGQKEILSPFILKRLKPVLTIEKVEIEYWAGDDGTVTVGGKTWAPLEVLREKFGGTKDAIKRHLAKAKVPSIQAKARSFGITSFYDLGAASVACASIIARGNLVLYATHDEASAAAKAENIQTVAAYREARKKNPKFPANPRRSYAKDWISWTHFLRGEPSTRRRGSDMYATHDLASQATQKLKIANPEEYKERYKEDPRLPSAPHVLYAADWISWPYFLRGERKTEFYKTIEQASDAAVALGITSARDYALKSKNDPRLPSNPNHTYAASWISWPHFLRLLTKYEFLSEASAATRVLGVSTITEYLKRHKEDPRLPRNPSQTYAKEWISWPHFLRGEEPKDFYATQAEASLVAQKLGITSKSVYMMRYKEDLRLPSNPQQVYASEWKGWPHFLGKMEDHQTA